MMTEEECMEVKKIQELRKAENRKRRERFQSGYKDPHLQNTPLTCANCGNPGEVEESNFRGEYHLIVYCSYCGAGVIDIENGGAMETFTYFNCATLVNEYETEKLLIEKENQIEELKKQSYEEVCKTLTDFINKKYNLNGFDESLNRDKPERRHQQEFQGFVYIMKDNKKQNCYKIGKTKDITSRLKALKTGNPDLQVIATVKSIDYDCLEKYLHWTYRQNNISCEWFSFTDDELQDLIRLNNFVLAV